MATVWWEGTRGYTCRAGTCSQGTVSLASA